MLSVKGDLTRLQGNILQPILYGSIALILLILRITPVKTALIGLRNRLQNAFRGVKPQPRTIEVDQKRETA